MKAVYGESGLVVEIQEKCRLYGQPFLIRRHVIVAENDPIRFKITEVEIDPKVNTLPAGALAKCAITSLVIPDNVCVIEKDAVRNCLYLESVTVSEGVKLIEDGAFSNCINLRLVEASENTHVSEHAFRECNENLIIVAAAKHDKVTSMEDTKDKRKQELINMLKTGRNAGIFVDGEDKILYDRNEWEIANDETGEYLHWIGFRNKRDFYEITIPEGVTNAYRIFDAIPDDFFAGDFFGKVTIKCSESLIRCENVFGDYDGFSLSFNRLRLLDHLCHEITKNAILQNYRENAADDKSAEDLRVMFVNSMSDKKTVFPIVVDEKTNQIVAICCDKENVIHKEPFKRKYYSDSFCMKEFMRENGLTVLPIRDVLRALLPENPLMYTEDEYMRLAKENQDYKELKDSLLTLNHTLILPRIDIIAAIAAKHREESILEAFREKYPDSGQLEIEDDDYDGQVYTFVIDRDCKKVVGILDTEKGKILTYEDLEQKMLEPETGPQKE